VFPRWRASFRGLLALTLLLLSACSSTTFVYNRMDFILPWYVDDYTDLNGEQTEYIDDLLAPFLAWHRSQELPRYIEILDRIEANLDEPATAGEVADIASSFEQAWLRLEDESLDWLLDLGTQLDKEQVQEFLDSLWKQQREFEEKYLERSNEEFVDESYDNMLDSARDYFGRLDKEQKQRLQQASADLKRSDSAWLKERADWLEQLAVFLQREPGWQQRLRDAVAARPQNVSQGYRHIYEHNAEVLYGALADLLNSRSEKQDKYLRKKLAGLRGDLETLVAQGDKPASAG